jgi:hypothetical protein
LEGGSSGSTSRVSAAESAVVTTHTRSAGTSGSMRSKVVRISGRSPTRARNCLGLDRRDAGQNRVPDPPAMITACSIACLLRNVEPPS